MLSPSSMSTEQYLLNLIYFLLSIVCVQSLYEDQIGKFDWRLQYVGCPQQILFDRHRSSKPSESIIVSTESNVIAALSTSTGNIIWRQVQETAQWPPILSLRHKLLISIVNDGRLVRAWDKTTGFLKWQSSVGNTISKNRQILWIDDHTVAILVGYTVSLYSSETGEQRWSRQLDSSINWLGLVSSLNAVSIVGGSVNDGTIVVVKVDRSTGIDAQKRSIAAQWFDDKRCQILNSLLVCAANNNHHIYTIDIAADPFEIQSTSVDDNIQGLEVLHIDDHIGVRVDDGRLVIYRTTRSAAPIEIMRIDKWNTVSGSIAIDRHSLLSVIVDSTNLVVYDLTNPIKPIFTTSIGDQSRSLLRLLSVSAGSEYEIATIGVDCQFDLFVYQKSQINLEWSRQEALASISTVEMVDLPLTEAQANIETEFSATADSVVHQLLRRLSAQMQQLRRTLIGTIEQILSTSTSAYGSSNSFAQWFESLRTGGGTSRSSTVHKDSPLERDYFNLHKLIVATTLNSKVFGIDNRQGSIIWQLWLGADVEPLDNIQGASIPLIVQRTTAHYPFPSQCLVAARSRTTGNGIIIIINPITGDVIDRIVLDAPLRQLILLPMTNEENVNIVLIVDANNNTRLYPNVAELPIQPPIYIMSVDAKTGTVAGAHLNAQSRKLEPTWHSRLSLSTSESIIGIASKRFTERVHSQGRVLGDRSVLYKYTNPNLIAVATLLSDQQQHKSTTTATTLLSIYLIDSVNGRVVHVARHAKATAPVHMVHCENWIAYTFWNEKLRRMELNVIELYEGYQQMNRDRFSSLTATLPLTILQQAYIFSQGVSALAVTETEQGLTTRNLIIAMPFGGVMELSKNFVDARRPLEPQPEHREEMLIPYMPEVPIATEDMINYNQSVIGVRGIKSCASGLESTSLVFVYGLDLFYTRLNPSGTFDILKDDFDHLLISAVLLVLIAASVISKRLARRHDLKQAWR